MARKFSGEDIERRLGIKRGESARAEAEASEGGVGAGTVLFSIGSLSAAIGGAYLLATGGEGLSDALTVKNEAKPAYRSTMAATCDRGWKDVRDNRDQIHCYMAHNLIRLCDPLEKQALVEKLVAYQKALDRAEGELQGAALSMMANRNSTWAMGAAEARSRDQRLTQEQRDAALKETMDRANVYMAPATKALEAFEGNTTSIETIVDDVKTLAEAGYIGWDDFSKFSTPKIVQRGLDAARRVYKLCR